MSTRIETAEDREALAYRLATAGTMTLVRLSDTEGEPTADAQELAHVALAWFAARQPAPTVSAEQVWDEGFTRGFYAAQSLPSDADASESTVQNPYEVRDV